MPEPGGQPRLALQRLEKSARLADRVPHLRQERRAAAAVFDSHAVDAGPQLREQVRFVVEGNRLAHRQHRHFDRRRFELDVAQWQEAGIAERRSHCVGLDVGAQRADCRERADAAAQFAVLHQRHERRARALERFVADRTVTGESEFGANRIARDPQQRAPKINIAHFALPCANANDA